MANKKQEDMRFMMAEDAAMHIRPSQGANWLFIIIIAMVIWGITWMAITQVEERSQGRGEVMPSSDMQTIQSMDTGTVQEILVSAGQRVTKGQTLLRMENVQFDSENRGIEAQKNSFYAKRARLLAESAGGEAATATLEMPETLLETAPEVAEAEMALYQTRQEELALIEGRIQDEITQVTANKAEVQATISKLRKSITLLEKELEITRKLVLQKAAPEIEQIRLERDLNNHQGDLASAIQSHKSLAAKLKATTKALHEKRKTFQSQARAELTEVEMQIKSLEENAITAQDRVDRTEMKSPVDGIVQTVTVKTVGGVIEPAQPLIEIVPVEDDLLIRAKMLPSDIAFIRPDMPVRVSLTAYDPQIYGRLTGAIERVSADSAMDPEGNLFFEIDIRTDTNYLEKAGKKHYISPGMVADVEVITGERSILTYMLRPIVRAREQAFTSR